MTSNRLRHLLPVSGKILLPKSNRFRLLSNGESSAEANSCLAVEGEVGRKSRILTKGNM